MKIIGVIPARYHSSRLPAKPLADINGKPMVWHVWNQAVKAKVFSDIIVATDDRRIVTALKKFPMHVMMTSKKHRNGTERIAEVAQKIPADIVVNIQGDEPLLPIQNIRRCITLCTQKNINIATVAIKITDNKEIHDTAVVKTIISKEGKALLFSRLPIPYHRDHTDRTPDYYKHIGLYAFKKRTLLHVVGLKPTMIEQAEKLEQLRWLYHGFVIHVARVQKDSCGVDTPRDLSHVRKLLRKELK